MWLMLNFYCEFSVGLKLMWPMLILITRIYMGSRYYIILFFWCVVQNDRIIQYSWL